MQFAMSSKKPGQLQRQSQSPRIVVSIAGQDVGEVYLTAGGCGDPLFHAGSSAVHGQLERKLGGAEWQ
jgi:hypothetical protein